MVRLGCKASERNMVKTMRSAVAEGVGDDLRRDAVPWDLHARTRCRLDVSAVSIKDGLHNSLLKKLVVVRADIDSTLTQSSRRRAILAPSIVPGPASLRHAS